MKKRKDIKMENPATWNYATQVISDALGESDRQVRAGIFRYSPARIIHDVLEKEGLLKSAPGEGSELPALKVRRSTCDTTLSGHEVISRGDEAPYAYTCAGSGQEICDAVNSFLGLKAALSSPQQEWIDCKQKMPEEKGRGWFLITNGNRVDVGLLLHGKTFMGHALQFEEVTHWQPLPAPPVTAEGKDRG